MKIVTICGCGLGTCFVLKFTTEKAARELNISATVIPSDIGSCALEEADLYLAPYGLNTEAGGTGRLKITAIRNVVSVSEVKAALQRALAGNG